MTEKDEDDRGQQESSDTFAEQAVDSEAVEAARRNTRYEALASREDYAENLERAAKQYRKNHDLQPFTLVQWKPRMRNMVFPHYGRPMIVLGPVEPGMLPTNSLFPIPPEEFLATLLVGFLDAENDFTILRVDPSRVQPWVAAESPALSED